MGVAEELLKQARLDSGMSQMALADILGYSTPQLVSNWERNKCRFPHSMAKKICVALNLEREVLKKAMSKDYEKFLDSIF